MDELWQCEEREMELQDKMGKDFYHRLDRLIKLKEQEQVNRDSSYLKEKKQDNRKAPTSRSRTRRRSSSLGYFINIPPRRQEQAHKAGSRTSTLQMSRIRSIPRKMRRPPGTETTWTSRSWRS